MLHWDIFCKVIDNLGDIGVSWRLARQLQFDYRQTVRLWVDDLDSLKQIAPQIKPDCFRQIFQGIDIRLWQSPFEDDEPVDVVIEMFACDLPDKYIDRMAKRPRAPVWINLEYLSAEKWVQEYHGLPSPHPRLPLTKIFFFPGFVPGTGGLLREKNLIESIKGFGEEKQQQFWQSIGVRLRAKNECRVSLFCYEHAPVEALIVAWSRSPVPVFLILPEGKIADRVSSLLNSDSIWCDGVIQSGQLSVQIIPFLEQGRYDQLLWSCDLNFVRGEDSFVRAQWAGKPFVWHIYPQSDMVHWNKLNAFLEMYLAHMPDKTAGVVRKFWQNWNGMEDSSELAWESFLECVEGLAKLNAEWRKQLELQDDLASNLVQFVSNQL